MAKQDIKILIFYLLYFTGCYLQIGLKETANVDVIGLETIQKSGIGSELCRVGPISNKKNRNQ